MKRKIKASNKLAQFLIAILNYEILCNCVYLTKPGPPFLTREMVAHAVRLSVITDVSNDLSYNPIFGISTSTNFSDATVSVGLVDVIEIENLPALTPLDSSLEYSSQLFPHLLELIAGEVSPDSVWEKALLKYFEHHDIPQLALECGRELAELSVTKPETFSVEFLQNYFAGLFAKNPLSRTDRLYFVDYLLSGAAEILSANARETFAALLSKADLDCIYDSSAMSTHHALLRTIYGFSRSPAFQDIVGVEVRDDFYEVCDALSSVIDQQSDVAGKFDRAKELFLRKLGPNASDPALTKFLSEVHLIVARPLPSTDS